MTILATCLCAIQRGTGTFEDDGDDPLHFSHIGADQKLPQHLYLLVSARRTVRGVPLALTSGLVRTNATEDSGIVPF